MLNTYTCKAGHDLQLPDSTIMYKGKEHCVLCSSKVATRYWEKSGFDLVAFKAKRLALLDSIKKVRVVEKKLGAPVGIKRALLLAQGNKCAICGVAKPTCKVGWVVDHNHKTGKIRGVLCSHCNKGLGFFKDDPKILVYAMRYLLDNPN